MNGNKKSFAKVFLLLGFQVVMSSLVGFCQAVDAIDEDDLQSDKVIRAPMPGRLTKVNVQKGQEVKEGEVLYIIEAMKMELMVRSPFAGAIKDIFFRASDIVEGHSAVISFMPPYAERKEMNQAPTGRNKDISITLATYATEASSSANHAETSLPPTEAPATESSSHKPPATEAMQKERILHPHFAKSFNCIFNGPTDGIDSHSAPVHSPDENENRRPFVDSRDYLILLFSYATSPPPPGSFPPDSYPPRSSPRESPTKEMLRKPHAPYLESGKERSSLHARPMNPMRVLPTQKAQEISNDSSFTVVKWVCGSIVLCLLILTSKVISYHRLRPSQVRVFNQIKYLRFSDMKPHRFMTKRRGRNMNRVIFTKWKAG